MRRGGERGCEQVDTVPLSAFLEPAPKELETGASAAAEVGSRRSRMSTASTAAMFATLLAGKTRSGRSMPKDSGAAQ